MSVGSEFSLYQALHMASDQELDLLWDSTSDPVVAGVKWCSHSMIRQAVGQVISRTPVALDVPRTVTDYMGLL